MNRSIARIRRTRLIRAELTSNYRATEIAYIDSGMVGEALQTSRQILERRTPTLAMTPLLAQPGADPGEDWILAGPQRRCRGGADVLARGARPVRDGPCDARKSIPNMPTIARLSRCSALAESRLSQLEEVLGDRGEARRHIRDAIAHQAALADSDSSKQSWARQLRDFRTEGARLESLNGGLQELARGWAQYASQLAEIAYPLPARMEAARKAVDLHVRAAIRSISPKRSRN